MIVCPNCGSQNLGLAGTRVCPTEETLKTGIATIDYMGCFDCKIMFQKNKIDPSFYKENYRKALHMNSYTVLPGNIVGEYRKAVIIDEDFKAWGIKPTSCMDVGSSTGILLRYLEKEYGCYTQGVEPGVHFRLYSIQHGTKTVADIKEIDRQFDLITTVHVLEHQVEPIPFLKEIVTRMSKYIYVEVPYLSPSLPHHLLFTMETLKDMLARVGIKVIHERDDRSLCVIGML